MIVDGGVEYEDYTVGVTLESGPHCFESEKENNWDPLNSISYQLLKKIV